jgi:uncharacterized protein (TIGR00255 family)
MTGYGRADAQAGDYLVRAEARSVNNRNLRVTCRLPDRLQGLDPELEKLLRSRLARGTVTLALHFDDFSGDPGYVIDEAAAAHYRARLGAIGGKLGLEGDVTLETLLALPAVVRRNVGDGEIPAELHTAAMQAAGEAVEALVASRRQEGANIWRDILDRCEALARRVDKVEAEMPGVIAQYRQRILERLGPLMEEIDAELDEERVRKEVVFYADRTDVTEEITRMRSHLELMRDLGEQSAASGRRAEFIAQEMFREANTMNAKAGDAAVIPDLLEIKAEVEKIREQALNVE